MCLPPCAEEFVQEGLQLPRRRLPVSPRQGLVHRTSLGLQALAYPIRAHQSDNAGGSNRGGQLYEMELTRDIQQWRAGSKGSFPVSSMLMKHLIRTVIIVAVIVVATASRAPAIEPGLAELAEQGGDQLYSLEFDRGTATFERIRREYPAHPAGPMLVAATHWWKARYWFAKPDKAAEAVMETNLAEAVKLARAMRERPETRCEGDFFLGGALGARAHWELLKGNWMRAALGGRESVHVLYSTLSCTEYADEARFGLGLYEYAAASLPWSLRWLSRFVVGGSPTKEEGLAKLAAAAERSRFMRNDAQSTLAIILSLHRNDPAGAMKYASMLIRERPGSPVAHSLHAQALFFDGKYDRVLAETATALKRAEAPGSTFAMEIPAFCYFRGMALAMQGHLPEARAAFDRAVSVPGRAAWTTAARLKRGCLLDIMGRRGEAVADYRVVLKSPDPWRLSKLAKKHLASPCTMEEFRAEASPHGGY